jgi:hypothetical protein
MSLHGGRKNGSEPGLALHPGGGSVFGLVLVWIARWFISG